MSLYAVGDFGYLQQVEAYFLSHSRVGVMLSSLDIELLRTWRADGIPVEAVCAGIKQTFSDFGEPPRSIYQCRRHVEYEIKAWMGRRSVMGGDAGGPGGPAPLPGRDLPDPTSLEQRRRRQRYKNGSAKAPQSGASQGSELNRRPDDPNIPEDEVLLRCWYTSMQTLVGHGSGEGPDLIRDAYRWAYRHMVELRQEALKLDDPTRLMSVLPLAIGEIEAGMYELAFEKLDAPQREAIDHHLTPDMLRALKRMSPDARERQRGIWRRRLMEERLGLRPFFTP